MGNLIGFGPLNRNTPLTETDVQDDTYPMRPKSLKSKNYNEPSKFPKIANYPYYTQTRSECNETQEPYS